MGAALEQIAREPEVERALFELLEIERLVDGPGRITLLPQGGGEVLGQLLAAGSPANK